MAIDLKSDRPLRADAARNRARILKAARTVFAERGLDGTMDDVAQASGLGVGTVYRRFADRAALVDALFEESIQAQVARAQAALSEPDPGVGLEGYLRDTCEDLARDRGLREVMLGSTFGQHRLETGRERIRPLVRELVDRARESGAVRSDVTFTDASVILLMVCAVADFTEPVVPGLWRRYVALLLDALRPGAATLDLDAFPALGPDGMARAMDLWRGSRRASR